MLSEIILKTLVIPSIMGCILFFVARTLPKFALWGAFITGIALTCIYVLLEGWPSIPPISSKHKIALLLAGITLLIPANVFLRINRFVLVVGLVGLALIWVGWNRVGDIEMLPRFLAAAVPIVIGGWSFQKYQQQDQAGLFWPITLIAFAIGGALISLLGVYIGFAQVMGAMAAFLGGFALLTYIFLLHRPHSAPSILPHDVHLVVFLSMMSALIAIALFAPEVSTIAIAVLGVALLAPMLSQRITHTSPTLQLVLYGLVTAIPVGVAIAIATLWP